MPSAAPSRRGQSTEQTDVDPERDPYPATFGRHHQADRAGWSGTTCTTCGSCPGSVQAQPSGLLQGLQRATQKYKPDTPMAVTITAFKDNTFEFTVKSPSVTWYLKKAVGIESSSSRPGHMVASALSLKHVYKIAKIKQSDPYCQYMSLESICNSIIGTANTMGIKIVKELE